jgi:biopolymer transport protein ExbB/TolQ
MISKLQLLRSVQREDDVFLSRYRAEKHPLGFFKRGIRLDNSPVFCIYRIACEQLQQAIAPKLDPNTGAKVGRRLTLSDLDHVRSAMERAAIEESQKLEKNMGVLATAVSASPYLGLLGTVWGVMNSFGGMAVAQSTAISAVAPGISSALLTTVVGLLVALPSLVGYNFLTARIRQSHTRLQNFVDELAVGLEQALQSSRGRAEEE